jgi:hypothetical protein
MKPNNEQARHYGPGFHRPLIRVDAVLCPDGASRTAHISGEPDTMFSVPAYVYVKSKRVRGFLTCRDGIYRFHSKDIASHEWLPKLSKRVKVGDRVMAYGNVARVAGFMPSPHNDGTTWIAALFLLSRGDGCYMRPLSQAAVDDVLPDIPDGGAFLRWFHAGELASVSDLQRASDYGSLSDRHFTKHNANGSLKA